MSEETPEKSVALVGRPNVGKSRIFNRLLGRRVSIVHDKPGVTRDIVVEPLAKGVLLMDTGGMFATGDVAERVIADATNKQANFAIMAADVIVFVVDSQTSLTPLDEEIASILRASGKRVILAVNKVDVPDHKLRNGEFYSLGFKSVAEISAEHGEGFDILWGLLEKELGRLERVERDDAADRIKVCFAGRPNVGKSSISNRVLGEERLIVSDVAGTTRDAVKCDIDIKGESGEDIKLRLFDTAGLKPKRKTNTSLDFLSTNRTRRAIESSDVVFLVLDAMEGVSELDKRLAGEILDIGASIIVVVNKWDYATRAFAEGKIKGYKNIREFGRKFDEAVRAKMPFIGDGPIYFVSALENKGIERLMEAAWRVYKKMNSTVTTGRLNSIVSALIDATPPPAVSGKRFKVYYSVKTSARPYTIKMFCNRAGALSKSYERYLVGGIRAKLKLGGVAIKLDLVGKTPQTLQERLAK